MESDQLEVEKARIRALYGENKRIIDEGYDKSLAVKCINGTLVGRKTDNVIAYRGIPFVGRQPVGDDRWKAPVDYVADDGVYEAYYNGKTPCEVETVGDKSSLYVQGEDCLHLNIWLADDPGASKRPVMVWIHGGAFEGGGTVDPSSDCHKLAKENPDVIFASIEYRLGIFGFFHLSHLPDGSEYPDAQNLGLLDQMMALKWIHENIEGFGGDPDRVTIFGESAGGASVTLLPLMKGSHAYIRRFIAESGASSLSRTVEQSIEATTELMEALGCETVADLKQVPDEKLLLVSATLLGMRNIGPERDGIFLPLDTYASYGEGVVADIEMMHGCNKDEFHYFAKIMGIEAFTPWGEKKKQAKLAQYSEEDRKLAESFCADIHGRDDFESSSRFLDQVWFNGPLIRQSEEQAKAGGKSFTYYFSTEARDPVLRSGHGVEVATVLGKPELGKEQGMDFDETFSKVVRAMWVQFAKCGDPSLTAEMSPDGKAHEWPAYDVENKYVMVLDESDIHVAPEAECKIVDWERMYPLTDYYVC